ncbi:hypothetical protein PRIPAC_97991 [Pristionchus pacificus]|uniref:Uncharacterized protein n=1 Tax=Pristionchus pacificus TaxID=54126 RepID=A0A2A6BD68_PRIPA|nr:hypothetical protein PRIPAC_97991 [Pristionchus pacificus]|eukprot:PDM63825.1 hypothetical protein PRIPAC_49798 [Pristionchus pacificus]
MSTQECTEKTVTEDEVKKDEEVKKEEEEKEEGTEPMRQKAEEEVREEEEEVSKPKEERRESTEEGEVPEDPRDSQSLPEIPSSPSTTHTSSPKEKDESSENAKTDEDTKKREEVSDMDGRKKKVARRRLPAKAGVHIDEQSSSETSSSLSSTSKSSIPEMGKQCAFQKPRHPTSCHCRGRSYGCPCYLPAFMHRADEVSRERWPEAHRSEQKYERKAVEEMTRYMLWKESIDRRLGAYGFPVPEGEPDNSPIYCYCGCGRDAWPDEQQMHKARQAGRKPVSHLHPPVAPLPPVQPRAVQREPRESDLHKHEESAFVRILNASINDEPYEEDDRRIVEQLRQTRRGHSDTNWSDLIAAIHRNTISPAWRMPFHRGSTRIRWITISSLSLAEIGARAQAIRRMAGELEKIPQMQASLCASLLFDIFQIYFMLCHANHLSPVECRRPRKGDTVYDHLSIENAIGTNNDQELIESFVAAVENTGPDRHFYVEYSKRSALEWTMKLGEKYKQRMGTPKPRHEFSRRPVFATSNELLEGMQWFRDFLIVEVRRAEVAKLLPIPPGTVIEEPVPKMSPEDMIRTIMTRLESSPHFPTLPPTPSIVDAEQSSPPSSSSHPVDPVEDPTTESDSTTDRDESEH